MCQKEFGKGDAMLADAREQHQVLLGRLMTGPGDSEGAMHRAERLYGLPYWSQWNLRHKRRASVTFVDRIRNAYLAMLESSVRRDLEKLKAEQAKDNSDAVLAGLVAEATALLAKIEERV